MIYTRFGSPVTLVAFDPELYHADVKTAEGKVLRTIINELKADNGLIEILDAAKGLPKPTKVKRYKGRK